MQSARPTRDASPDEESGTTTAGTDGERSRGDRRPVALIYRVPWPYALGASAALLGLLLGCVLLVTYSRRRRRAPAAAMFVHMAQSAERSPRAGRQSAATSPPQDRRRAA